MRRMSKLWLHMVGISIFCVLGTARAQEAGEEATLPADEPAAVEAEDVQIVVVVAEEEADLEKPEGMDAAEWARQEAIRRQDREIQGLRSLEEGWALLRQKDYAEAGRQFDAALRLIPERPATLDDRARARRGAAEAAVARGQDLVRAEGSDLREARRLADRALVQVPDHRAGRRLHSQIDREQARRSAAAARPVPAKDRPAVVERTGTVSELLAEGKDFYTIGDYSAAVPLFERVLQLDEYNTDAMRFLKKIEEERYRISSTHREMTVARAMQQVRGRWNTPILREVELPESARQPAELDTLTASERTREKMTQIIIPSIEFRQANIADVINFLVEASITGDPEREGVNIILNLQVPGEGPSVEGLTPEPRRAPGADDFGFGEFMDPVPAEAAPAFSPAGASSVPNITLNLRRIALLDALKIITEVSGLRYRIDGSVVLITPANVVGGPVVTRMYRVQPTLLDVMIERDEGQPQRDRGEFVEMGTARPTMSRADVREFFQRAGVPFPAGTSITYNPGISTLIVANTPENLELFERILAQLDVIPSQVEIEARFVELAQSDIQAAGLEWILTDNWDIARRKGNLPMASTQRIQADADNRGFSKGLRFFQFGSSGAEAASSVTGGGASYMGSILTFSSILTNPEMQVVLHALNQSGATDLLSAPRVTTRSGSPAQIQVVQELIYPTEFEVTEPVVSEASGFVSPPTVTPMSFETRETGVILNVTPTVGPDGYTIDLALVPEVSELVGWIQYGSTFATGPGQSYTYNIPQPLFQSRSVTTSIVIWDGQTVVMGGLIREELQTFKDKVPLLGDIPLLGRLFRSEGQYSEKRNLLIFVTARLVDPAGQPIHKADGLAMPGEGALLPQ